MSGSSSYYVHSHASQTIAPSLGLGGAETNSNAFTVYLSSALSKLVKIKDELNSQAEAFLDGYSPPAAQEEGQNAWDRLNKEALELINGPLMQKFAQSLVRKEYLNKNQLETAMDETGIDAKLKKYISNLLEEEEGDLIPLNKIANALTKKGGPVITVSRSGAYFQKLGFLANTKSFDFDDEEKDIASIVTKRLSSRKGRLLDYTKAILRKSNAYKGEDLDDVILRFYSMFEKEFKKKIQDITFVDGNGKDFQEAAQEFLDNFEKKLVGNIDSLVNYSQGSGELGEGVTAAITQSGDMTIVAVKIGDVSDEKGIKRAKQKYAEMGKNIGEDSLTPIRTHHDNGKQSQTDLILTNIKKGITVRAQSKNLSATRFIEMSETTDKIDNFRFKIQSSLELGSFINNLSNTTMGAALNAGELDGILSVLVQSVWMDTHPSTVGSGYNASGKKVSGKSTLEDFRHNLEAWATGQVTNMLGVTVKDDIANDNLTKEVVELTGSNIFFLENGRLTKTSDLVDLVIKQIEAYLRDGFNIDKAARALIVKLDTSSVSWEENSAGRFYYEKLKYLSKGDIGGLESYGEAQGEAGASGIKVSATIGSALVNFGNSSWHG